MDGSSYEKLSIRDSAKSLKKYGSTSKHVTKNENFIKHFVSDKDTLQGIALKYDVTIEQIRRANRLWASDSLFLREYLLIPVPENVSGSSIPPAQTDVTSPTSTKSRSDSFDEDSVSDFLVKIDASIASTKEEVKKTRGNSEFAKNLASDSDRRKPAVSRMKQMVNNNGTVDFYATPQTVVLPQGRKMKRLEQQQDELFEL